MEQLPYSTLVPGEVTLYLFIYDLYPFVCPFDYTA